MKPVRFSRHARENMTFRGATEDEVTAAVRGAAWQQTERGRLDCRMEFAFGREWNGRHYAKKQVRPVFVDEAAAIVVGTAYVYYLP